MAIFLILIGILNVIGNCAFVIIFMWTKKYNAWPVFMGTMAFVLILMAAFNDFFYKWAWVALVGFPLIILGAFEKRKLFLDSQKEQKKYKQGIKIYIVVAITAWVIWLFLTFWLAP